MAGTNEVEGILVGRERVGQRGHDVHSQGRGGVVVAVLLKGGGDRRVL